MWLDYETYRVTADQKIDQFRREAESDRAATRAAALSRLVPSERRVIRAAHPREARPGLGDGARGGGVSRRSWAVAIAGALVVMSGLGFGRFSYTMLLPATRQGLGLSYTAAGILGTANLAGYLLGSFASSAVAQRVGTQTAIAGGLAVLALSLAWMATAQGILVGVAARGLAGVAGAIVYVQALGLIGLWFPGRARGLASGIMHSGNGGGLILTGMGLPLLLATLPGEGWRAGWAALALATLATVPVGWAYCRSSAAEGGTPDPSSPDVPMPAQLRQTVRHSSVAAYGGLYGLFGLSYIVYATFFAETLRSRGLSLSQTGLIWALVGTLSLASGTAWGALSDRIGRMAGLAVVFGLQAVAYLTFLNPISWSWILSGVLFGATAWGIPAIMAATMSDIGYAHGAASAFGRVTTVMGIGQAVGPVLAGAMADVTGNPSAGLWASAAAALGGSLWGFRTAAASRTSTRPVPVRQDR